MMAAFQGIGVQCVESEAIAERQITVAYADDFAKVLLVGKILSADFKAPDFVAAAVVDLCSRLLRMSSRSPRCSTSYSCPLRRAQMSLGLAVGSVRGRR